MEHLPFIAAMSHEIRTPMNGVLGLLELLGTGRLDAEQRATVELAERSARELLRILDEILDYARIGSGKLEIRNEVVALADEVVEVVWRTHLGNALGKDLKLTRCVDPRIASELLADPLRLGQILHNFVSNAVKFTAAGNVSLRADLVREDAQQQTVRFSVCDTGIGISPEAQARLFQPFSQAESSTERRFGGSGLGLAICQGLARALNGEIGMHSEVGKGTTLTLTVTLPMADASRRQAKPTLGTMLDTVVHSGGPAFCSNVKVLIVDDHATNRQVMLRQLRALGYAAETAANGLEALHKWRTGGFAIVITDCQMPEMDGFALARRIRQEEQAMNKGRTPVLACSASTQAADIEIAFEAGMDDFIVKPASMPMLDKLLGTWLPTAERQEALFDSAVLQELAGGQQALSAEILAEFDVANSADYAALNAAFELGDLAAVGRIAHAIKGAARTIGAMRYAAAAAVFECAWRAGDVAAAQSARKPFDAAYAELRAHLYAMEAGHDL